MYKTLAIVLEAESKLAVTCIYLFHILGKTFKASRNCIDFELRRLPISFETILSKMIGTNSTAATG